MSISLSSLSSLSADEFGAAYDDAVDYAESVKIVRGRTAAKEECGSLLAVFEREAARRDGRDCCLGSLTTGNHSALCPR